MDRLILDGNAPNRDEIITDIFNQDITLQPKGIIDVGCGDGTFLKHLYDLIISKTLRGKHIIEHPLKIIGTDINKAARIASREKLNSYNIDNIVYIQALEDATLTKIDLANPKNKNITQLIWNLEKIFIDGSSYGIYNEKGLYFINI